MLAAFRQNFSFSLPFKRINCRNGIFFLKQVTAQSSLCLDKKIKVVLKKRYEVSRDKAREKISCVKSGKVVS